MRIISEAAFLLGSATLRLAFFTMQCLAFLYGLMIVLRPARAPTRT